MPWNPRRPVVRPARRLRPGVALDFGGIRAEIVDGPSEGKAVLLVEAADVESAVEEHGSVPLPPYFKGVLDDDDRYQTVYADRVLALGLRRTGRVECQLVALDARDGAAYRAEETLRYERGLLYEVRVALSLPRRSYDVWVTPAGAAPVLVARDFALPPGAGAPTAGSGK